VFPRLISPLFDSLYFIVLYPGNQTLFFCLKWTNITAEVIQPPHPASSDEGGSKRKKNKTAINQTHIYKVQIRRELSSADGRSWQVCG
jgi:hypothetical protein